MNIVILDTSICTANVGDFIIMDSVNRELIKLFPMYQKIIVPTQEKIHYTSYQRIEKSKFAFIGGTNLLSSNMNQYNQWKVNLKDTFFMKNLILMGVGWWQYQKEPNFYTKFLLSKLLHPTLIHSVRDSYTEEKLKEIGIHNVINTSCPTMWQLTKEHCKSIPTTKANRVVFTLTDYNKDIQKDQQLINILNENYETVYFWPQGTGDLEYFNSLNNIKNIIVFAPTLNAYDNILDSEDGLDFIGTRLHAGIRALQKKRRTIILGVDNRAEEKKKDFNLNVLSRENIDSLQTLLNSNLETKIDLPNENIEKWKNQFRSV